MADDSGAAEPTDDQRDDADGDPDARSRSSASRAGVGVALGAAFGTVLLALTGEAYWIAIGAGVGVALGSAYRR